MKEDLILKKIEDGIKEGSSLIVRDILENIEKYKISPVISLDGKIKNLRPEVFDCTKVKNLCQLIKKLGYKADEFLFLESKNCKYSKNNNGLIQGFIICISKKSGKLKEYKANKNSSWTQDFSEDLKQKFFR